MREGLKPERYNLRLARHPALVSRDMRFGVKERMRHTGAVEVALDLASLAAAIDTLIANKVAAVAVCYLHAYANAAHERRTLHVAPAAASRRMRCGGTRRRADAE